MVSNAGKEPAQPVNTTETISPTEQAEGAAIDNAGVAIPSQNTTSTAANTPQSAPNAAGVAIPTLSTDAAGNGTTAQPSASADATLDFWVISDTPIEVTDATGKALMNGPQVRGGYKLSGKAPFRIQIDNVKNVKLNLNQQKIALDKYATDNKASFTLAP